MKRTYRCGYRKISQPQKSTKVNYASGIKYFLIKESEHLGEVLVMFLSEFYTLMSTDINVFD